MKIFSAAEIRAWDEYTIQHEPVASIDLMERAAASCLVWLEKSDYLGRSFSIYCGKGNNGGDGLALARLLSQRHCTVTVHILELGQTATKDFQANLERLHQTPVEVRFVAEADHLLPLAPGDVVIDAILGSGLNRKLEGVTALLVEHLNKSGNEIIAIDLPSGLFVDRTSRGNTVIRAGHTLSFQLYKLAFLMPENESCVGEVHLLDIGLHPGFLKDVDTATEMSDPSIIGAIFKPRQRFANKGNFGHALLVAGSFGKIGAAVLAGRACLRSGIGLLTVLTPGCGYGILQTTIPEAMILTDPDEKRHTALPPDGIGKYAVVGVGPGLGTEDQTVAFLRGLLQQYRKPMVVDADALNILGANPELMAMLPPYSILTPHPKEFERLFGASDDDFGRVEKARAEAQEHHVVIVLKGHYTFIALPDGKGYFNSTGNAGMAKGGSGDSLTGILTALVGQGYSPSEAAIFGVYLHGLAGDLAAAGLSQESMLPSDLTDHLGKAFQRIQQSQ
jgi:NAD(P)H-hydrate epimerase